MFALILFNSCSKDSEPESTYFIKAEIDDESYSLVYGSNTKIQSSGEYASSYCQARSISFRSNDLAFDLGFRPGIYDSTASKLYENGAIIFEPSKFLSYAPFDNPSVSCEFDFTGSVMIDLVDKESGSRTYSSVYDKQPIESYFKVSHVEKKSARDEPIGFYKGNLWDDGYYVITIEFQALLFKLSDRSQTMTIKNGSARIPIWGNKD